jgi:AraC-like DNA-binding protein
MPSSAVLTFTDPDDYAAAIRATRAELTVTGRGQFAAKLTRIDLHRLWMQRFSDNLPRVAHSAAGTGRAIISFRTHPGPSLLWGGVEMQPANITRHNEGGSSFQHSSGLACWGAMSLPVEDMAAAGTAIAGLDLTPPRDALTVTAAPAAMAKLQRLHAAAGQLAEDAPEIIANPEAARGLEQALIQAMIDCLGEGEVREDRSALRHHAIVLRRFRRAVEANPDRTLYMTELCAATGASDRTLRACCQEFLGMSPMRYLWLRRMHLARRALGMADPAAATVTDIATNYGFWELGRFSVAYRSLFAESPSAALRRPPDDPRVQKNRASPWQLPESA